MSCHHLCYYLFIWQQSSLGVPPQICHLFSKLVLLNKHQIWGGAPKLDCYHLFIRYYYYYSLYGCVIWDITNVHVEQVCSVWRTGVRRIWGLPFNTHNLLILLISNRLPLYDEIRKCMLTFIQNCLLSESDLVSFVARHAVWFGRMSSPHTAAERSCGMGVCVHGVFT